MSTTTSSITAGDDNVDNGGARHHRSSSRPDCRQGDDDLVSAGHASDGSRSRLAGRVGPGLLRRVAGWQPVSLPREFASELAIAELFSNPGGGMELYGCRQTAQDLFDCPFRYEGGALHMDVYGDYVNGHKVEDVRYMVD